jgi:hypothetical protein
MPIHFTEKRDIETALQMNIRDYPDAGLNQSYPPCFQNVQFWTRLLASNANLFTYFPQPLPSGT